MNEDIVPHTVTGRSKEWNSGSIGAAHTWQVVPTTTGPYEYYCELHPTMRGVVMNK